MHIFFDTTPYAKFQLHLELFRYAEHDQTPTLAHLSQPCCLAQAAKPLFLLLPAASLGSETNFSNDNSCETSAVPVELLKRQRQRVSR